MHQISWIAAEALHKPTVLYLTPNILPYKTWVTEGPEIEINNCSWLIKRWMGGAQSTTLFFSCSPHRWKEGISVLLIAQLCQVISSRLLVMKQSCGNSLQTSLFTSFRLEQNLFHWLLEVQSLIDLQFKGFKVSLEKLRFFLNNLLVYVSDLKIHYSSQSTVAAVIGMEGFL
jgi:hypothetical protein